MALVPLDLAPADGARVIGWSVGDEVVARARVRRSSPDEVVVETVELEDTAPASARSDLLEAIADVATAMHIRTADGSWSRSLDTTPDPAASAAVTLEELQAAIHAGWCRETSDDPELWTPDNPALGQCGVTALLVRELLGGEILVAHVVLDGRRTERHAWNRLPSGLTIDLTREQFRKGERLLAPSVEEPVLTLQHPERIELLRSRVRAQLENELSRARRVTRRAPAHADRRTRR